MEQFFKGLVGDTDHLGTPVGILIKAGSDAAALSGPEWSINMEIVDMLNASREACADAVTALSTRLKDGDNKVVYLTLVILETCMKNCGKMLASQIGAPFMQEMIAMTKGSRGKKNADEAARLLQQWGRAFEKDRAKLPLFFDTYVALKAKGVTFPPEDASRNSFPFQDTYDDLPAVTPSYKLPPPPSGHPHAPSDDTDKTDPISAASSYAPVPPESSCSVTNLHEFQRLEADLSTVFDKVTLCQDMLRESPGIHADELLAEVVGFLEACRDRLADIIEAGTQGLMTEELLGRCLKVNDAVLRTLDAEKSAAGGEKYGSAGRLQEEASGVGVGAAAAAKDGSSADDCATARGMPVNETTLAAMSPVAKPLADGREDDEEVKVDEAEDKADRALS